MNSIYNSYSGTKMHFIKLESDFLPGCLVDIPIHNPLKKASDRPYIFRFRKSGYELVDFFLSFF